MTDPNTNPVNPTAEPTTPVEPTEGTEEPTTDDTNVEGVTEPTTEGEPTADTNKEVAA